jgi:hypothetical protein
MSVKYAAPPWTPWMSWSVRAGAPSFITIMVPPHPKIMEP